MRPLLCLLAVGLLATAPAAQITSQTGNRSQADRTMTDRPMDMNADRAMLQSDLDRLNRDLQALDRNAPAGMRQDAMRYRQDYDRLRSDFDGMTTTDPQAYMRSRQDLTRRYDTLAGDVYEARLLNARDRSAYVQTGMDRLGMYDQQIADLERQSMNASADMRAEHALDRIRLRSLRDDYRDALYDARGTLRTDNSDAARQRATTQLARYDADFMSARRDAAMRGMMNGPSAMRNGPMRNGSTN